MIDSNQPNCKVEIQNDLKFVQDTLYVLSGKWKLPIVVSIYNGHHRYREIAKAVPGLTFRMLSRELNVLDAFEEQSVKRYCQFRRHSKPRPTE